MDKKQVVFIMTDTQRKDMLGCYGNKEMKTPHLDRLAEEGIKYNKCYTCQPVCGPARSALFTGLYPHTNGSWGNSMPLGDNVKSIGMRLSEKDIETAYIGKWHLDGGDYFGMGRCPKGWNSEYWYDMRCYLDELTEEERLYSRQIDSKAQEEFTYGHRCSNRAMEYLDRYKDEDFLLVVSYDEPHGPFLCPEPYESMYHDYTWEERENHKDNLDNKPRHHKVWAGDYDTEEIPDFRGFNKFFGCNSFVDYEIGRVLNKVREVAPDALIMYTSDHGDMLFSHGINNKGPAMYEEITNVPFIVSGKALQQKNVSNDYPMSHIHITPTIMDYFGLESSPLFEGESVLKEIIDNKPSSDASYIEFGRYEVDHDGFGGFQPIRCIVTEQYKLVINLLTSDELYDLHEDPMEMNNLIHDESTADIRNTLHDNLLNWMNETRDPFRGYYWERRPWRLDACEPTWDYTGMTRQRMAEYEPRQLDYSTGLEIKEAVRKK